MRKLTPKQQKFVDAYTGSVKDAAKASGYEYSAARRLATQSNIIAALKGRDATESIPTIANRQDRQQFWTDVMADTEESMTNRLRAAELLGKSEADFTDKIQQDTTLTVTRKEYPNAP